MGVAKRHDLGLTRNVRSTAVSSRAYRISDAGTDGSRHHAGVADLRLDVPPVPPERIAAGEITLVLHGPDEAAAICDAINDSLEHLRPFMAWADRPTTVTEQAMRLATVIEQARHGGDVVWSIVDPDGQIAGGTGLHRRGLEDGLEIGYWLHPDATGRGWVTAAAAGLARVAFEVFDVDLVRITCDEANVRSAAVPPRLGFRHVGTIDEVRHAPADTNRTMQFDLRRAQWADSPAARIPVSYS